MSSCGTDQKQLFRIERSGGKNRAQNQKTTVQEVDQASGQNSEARDVLEAGYVASGAEGAVLEASRGDDGDGGALEAYDVAR